MVDDKASKRQIYSASVVNKISPTEIGVQKSVINYGLKPMAGLIKVTIRGEARMTELTVRTNRREEFVDITDQVQRVVAQSGVQNGVCWLFIPHTTAGITINENADPSVKVDILEQLHRLIPPDLRYHHTEGNADAHIKAVLVGNSLSVPIVNGRLRLGTWQGIFFCEFDGPRTRRVWVQITPEVGEMR